ncbi:hypothetical protein LY78DRAFT_683919 [Colletotrichum sublineola]|nr:hypothetical protein LY78DRAFT_683919 [Colletotrichum sublineola]
MDTYSDTETVIAVDVDRTSGHSTNISADPGESIHDGNGTVWIRDDFPLWGVQANELLGADRSLIESLDRRVCIGTWSRTFNVVMYSFVTSPITMLYLYVFPVKILVDCSDIALNTILKLLRGD